MRSGSHSHGNDVELSVFMVRRMANETILNIHTPACPRLADSRAHRFPREPDTLDETSFDEARYENLPMLRV